jgi:hypothetical protein
MSAVDCATLLSGEQLTFDDLGGFSDGQGLDLAVLVGLYDNGGWTSG